MLAVFRLRRGTSESVAIEEGNTADLHGRQRVPAQTPGRRNLMQRHYSFSKVICSLTNAMCETSKPDIAIEMDQVWFILWLKMPWPAVYCMIFLPAGYCNSQNDLYAPYTKKDVEICNDPVTSDLIGALLSVRKESLRFLPWWKLLSEIKFFLLSKRWKFSKENWCECHWEFNHYFFASNSISSFFPDFFFNSSLSVTNRMYACMYTTFLSLYFQTHWNKIIHYSDTK